MVRCASDSQVPVALGVACLQDRSRDSEGEADEGYNVEKCELLGEGLKLIGKIP